MVVATTMVGAVAPAGNGRERPGGAGGGITLLLANEAESQINIHYPYFSTNILKSCKYKVLLKKSWSLRVV